jgi:hypothetical protein
MCHERWDRGRTHGSRPGDACPTHRRYQPLSNRERDARDCDRRIEPEGSAPFLRTELYFGSSKPDGSVITLEQFQHFLDQEITPRFPDGLTLLTGLGQSQCAEDRGNSLYLQAAVPTRIGAASG